MSGLEALSLTCNIFQVISFAHETVTLCKSVYKGDSPDAHLQDNAEALAQISANIHQQYQSLAPSNTNERNLVGLANKCNIAARALEEEVKFIIGHHQAGNLADAIRIVVKTSWRKKRLDRLEKSLNGYRDSMETQVMARICKQTDAIAMQQRHDFQKLAQDLQYFVTQIAAGHTSLSDLFKAEHLSLKQDVIREIKSHVSQETATSQDILMSHVSHEVGVSQSTITGHIATEVRAAEGRLGDELHERHTRAVSDSQRARLLNSLKFPAMNERSNQVTESYGDTFQWIFDQDDIISNNIRFGRTRRRSKYSTYSDDDSHNDLSWDSFADWLRSESNIYWISGKAGSGKSTLMKFLMHRPETKTALEIWSSGTVILSHFFWKPGSSLQNSLRGLLCSILHQTLSSDQDSLNLLLAKSKDLDVKDSHTDWSNRELRLTCLKALESYPSHICIFIDGLDEISDEDSPIELMRLLEEFRAIEHVKVCVSSRPEPQLVKRLSVHQHLRLQDLTADDMRNYANSALEPYLGQSGWEDQMMDDAEPQEQRPTKPIMVGRLVEKAEGVFLWLHLAVSSLIRGFENRDDAKDLLSRLEQLPNKLSSLYSEMWTRLNEDTELYRLKAAQYFNLVISSKNILASFEDLPRVPFYEDEWGDGRSVFLLMAAQEDAVQKAYLDNRASMDGKVLDDLCEKTKNEIEVRCAGLLEVMSTPDTSQSAFKPWKGTHGTDMAKQGTNDVPVSKHLNSRVYFVHRTAFDYLVDTEEGCAIRECDTSTEDQRWLRILRARLIETKMGYRKTHNFAYNILLPLTKLKDPSMQTDVCKFLQTCQNWFGCDYIRLDVHSNQETCSNFLTVASLPAFKDFVLSKAAEHEKPSSVATEILRDIGLPCIDPGMGIDMIASFLEPLLSLGADPNALGFTHWQEFRHSQDFPDIFPYTTPFCRFLHKMLRLSVQGTLKPSMKQLISVFLKSNPDLEARTSIAAILDPDIANGRKAFVNEVEYPDQFLDGDSWGGNSLDWTNCKTVYFILNVNLAFLVHVLERQDKSKASIPSKGKQLLPDENEAQPNAQVAFVVLLKEAWRQPSVERYRVLSDEFSRQAMSLVEPWLSGDHSDTMQMSLRKLAQESVLGSKNEEIYREVRGKITSSLARSQCGYAYRSIIKQPKLQEELPSHNQGTGKEEENFWGAWNTGEWSKKKKGKEHDTLTTVERNQTKKLSEESDPDKEQETDIWGNPDLNEKKQRAFSIEGSGPETDEEDFWRIVKRSKKENEEENESHNLTTVEKTEREEVRGSLNLEQKEESDDSLSSKKMKKRRAATWEEMELGSLVDEAYKELSS